LYALDAKTGEKKWDFQTNDKILSSPCPADGIVYVGSDDGHLYALESAGLPQDLTPGAHNH